MGKIDIENLTKAEKIEYLRANGWYELKSSNNWVNALNIPKNWKGLNLDDAFKKLSETNKRLYK